MLRPNKMRTAAQRAAEIRRIRVELRKLRRPESGVYGPMHDRLLDDLALAALLAIVKDAGLVAEAIVLRPRPAWVEAVVGPWPDGELLHPEDRAVLGEWGGLGEGT